MVDSLIKPIQCLLKYFTLLNPCIVLRPQDTIIPTFFNKALDCRCRVTFKLTQCAFIPIVHFRASLSFARGHACRASPGGSGKPGEEHPARRIQITRCHLAEPALRRETSRFPESRFYCVTSLRPLGRHPSAEMIILLRFVYGLMHVQRHNIYILTSQIQRQIRDIFQPLAVHKRIQLLNQILSPGLPILRNRLD